MCFSRCSIDRRRFPNGIMINNLSSDMSDKYYDERKIFLIAISAAVIISSFIVGSQFVQPSLSQGLIQQGQLAGFNETGNQTANQSA